MPPLPPIANVVRLTFKQFLSENADVINRIFMNYSGTPSVADMTALATTAGTAFAAHISPLLSNEHTLVEVTAEDLASSTGPVATVVNNTVGGTAFPSMGANVATCIQFKISRRYRGGHPRWYQAGMTIGDLADAQTWSAGWQTGILAAYNAMITAISGGSYPSITVGAQQNVSYFEGFTNHTFPSGRVRPIPNPRPGGPIKDVIVSVAINPHVASQRRRTLQGAI